MTIKTLYISDDGITFYNENACTIYEKELKENMGDPGVHLYSSNGVELPGLTSIGFINARFMQITNSNIAKALLSTAIIYQITKFPTEVGYYALNLDYKSKTYEWELVDKEYFDFCIN